MVPTYAFLCAPLCVEISKRGKLDTDPAHHRNHGQRWQLKPCSGRCDGMYRSPYPLECLRGGSHLDTAVYHSCVRMGWLLIEPFSFLLMRNWRNPDTAVITLVPYWCIPFPEEIVDISYYSFSASHIVSSSDYVSCIVLCWALIHYHCWCSNSNKSKHNLYRHYWRSLGLSSCK